MSLLWRNLMQLTVFLRPSPKHNIYSRFAQSINFTQYIQFPLFMKKKFSIEGISLFASRKKTVKASGSMTVEAAVVLPLFLFFFLNLGSAMEMIRLHSNLQLALLQVGNRLSVYGSPHLTEFWRKNTAEFYEFCSVTDTQIVFASEKHLSSPKFLLPNYPKD